MRLSPLFLLLALLVGSAVISCSRRPSMVLGQEDMAQLMADLHEAEGVVDQNYSAYRTDSSKRQLRQAVYVKHGVTQAQVDSSLAWYGYNIERYSKVYDRVLEILNKRLKSVKSHGSDDSKPEMNFAVEGDSAVVWSTYAPLLFSPRMERQLVSTMLQRDQYWRHGDRYVLRYKTVGTLTPVLSRLTVTYANDSTATRLSQGSRETWHTLTLDTDTAAIPQSVVMELRYAAPEGLGGIAAIDSVTITRIRTRDDKLPDRR